ncbi:Rrf2 family transcriptional regulator [Leptolyngbya sp. FACHB-261]|uniref:RrF2 family transcriptional regulator n=1 Tax=Leptolyngbya sp. FACHB-261 TaxID=2692806 RepID=UPI001686B89A|nr:Rrf2 family transcriptional regulator [Leptolyngbya sp. FACHB-261]MBD2099886.1 Rrf2 family transcriptional regulator [Leptolyngbya sp. FACHB-261]
MELPRRFRYVLLALVAIASRYDRGEPLSLSQIAVQQQIPSRYLESLLTLLCTQGLIQSQRGAKGGYWLAREPWRITLLDVLNSLEGVESRDQLAASTLESAVVSEICQEAQHAARKVLQRYTLKELCEQRDARQHVDPMYYI